MKNFIIGIPKGRIFKESLYFFKKFNIFIKDFKSKRKLYFKTNLKNFFLILIKNSDSKKYLNNNFVNFIIIGKDNIFNFNINFFYKYFKLKFFKFNFSIISNKYLLKNKILKKNIKINFKTKYLNLSKFYLKYKNLKYNIKIYKGSLELISLLIKNNIIFDITESENTIFENKIFNLKNIINLETILVINFDLIYKKFINNFFLNFKNYLKIN